MEASSQACVAQYATPVEASSQACVAQHATPVEASSQLYVAQHATAAEVEGEARAQIEMAKRAGIPISHLDNHMRTMLVTPVLFQVYWKMGKEYGLPVMLPNQQVQLKGVAA
jgi:hypothetical protein